MNRSIALFVALVTLLAHILAIHTDGAGNFAFPYDQGYVGYRLARNLVFEGQMVWNPGMSAYESYPSPLWVLVAALSERLTISVNLFCQWVGIGAMLVTTILLAQFRPDRTASLIAPVLLVTSGCAAAAAANGLETATLAMFAIGSFWAFERGHGARMAIALTLAYWTRPEGALFTVALLVLRLVFRGAPSPDDRKPVATGWFALPLVAIAAGLLVRNHAAGYVLSPGTYALFHPHAGQLADGVHYLLDCARSMVSPLLVVFPCAYLVRGRLSSTGKRALLVAAAWIAMVALQGRAPLPFAAALAPVLPLFFLGVQEGLTTALDSASRWTRRAALTAFALAIAGSALASKEPGDLGPIPMERWHHQWMKSSGSSRFGYQEPLGRLGLMEEIANTDRLRAVGIFVRDNVDPTSSILTPWPGSIAYLSRLHVFDLLGRTNPTPDTSRPTSWTRRERADTVAALDELPDYVVPLLEPAERAPSMRDIAREWLDELDSRRDEPGRLEAIEAALARFELITVPIYGYTRGTAPIQGEPYFLLRNRALALRPKLELESDGREFRVLVHHASHQQIVDLSVELDDSQGGTWSMRPTGEVVGKRGVLARTSTLVYNTGTRAMELLRARVPVLASNAKVVRIRAVLQNPGCGDAQPFCTVSDTASLSL